MRRAVEERRSTGERTEQIHVPSVSALFIWTRASLRSSVESLAFLKRRWKITTHSFLSIVPELSVSASRTEKE
jgi:hypothetical protein